jgi:DNA-binding NarL/FixJ family response regulator
MAAAMSAKFRVLIVEDYPVARDGIKSFLKDGRIDIVGEVNNGREAVRFVTEHDIDLVILDLSMPQSSGTEALPRIRRHSPKTKILIYTVHKDLNHLHLCLLGGAVGYIYKGDQYTDFQRAVLEVLEGQHFLSPTMTGVLVDAYRAAVHPREPTQPDVKSTLLSRQQLEVVKLMAEGYSYKEISQRLNIAEKTVANIVSSAKKKLGARSKAELIAYAIKNGLVDEE